MDSMYSGLTDLEGQVKSKNGRGKSEDVENSPVPIVRIDEDMFILVDDVLLLLERAVLEPLPPKDDKGPQNRMKLAPVSRLLLWKVLLIGDVFGGEDKGQKDIWCWISKSAVIVEEVYFVHFVIDRWCLGRKMWERCCCVGAKGDSQ